jgi:hypothetical protein
MRDQANTPRHSAAALTPSPATPDVARVEALAAYRLRVVFEDGLTGVVDMSAMVLSLEAGVFAVLADPARFAQVRITLGAVSWPEGLDLAPDAMYDAIKEHGRWVVD